MGNEADAESMDNTIGEVELALIAGEDTETGRTIPILTDDGVLQTIIKTTDGNALTDALNSVGTDELVARIEDSAGTQIDPATDALEAALKSNDTDEFVARLVGSDGVEVQEEALDTDAAAGDVALLTYLSRALQSVGQDELVSRITDADGTQIDPDRSPDYPDTVQQQDLIASGDLTIGPVSVARSEAVIISANSDDSNTWSASVEWQDGSGNVLQTESASDIGLSSTAQDWARLVRKGPQVEVTFTDESAAAQNNLNAYVDVHR